MYISQVQTLVDFRRVKETLLKKVFTVHCLQIVGVNIYLRHIWPGVLGKLFFICDVTIDEWCIVDEQMFMKIYLCMGVCTLYKQRPPIGPVIYE